MMSDNDVNSFSKRQAIQNYRFLVIKRTFSLVFVDCCRCGNEWFDVTLTLSNEVVDIDMLSDAMMISGVG